MKILLMDIETAPSKGYYFDLWKEGNILWEESEWYMLSFSYKWLDKKSTYVKALPDYSIYPRNKTEDYYLTEDLWKLLDEADMVIGHNGDKFDIRKANARFIKHGFKAPTPYKTIDTLKIARKYFKFDSNRLDALGEYLGLGRKEKTGGIQLWKDCMEGKMKAWNMMKKYNKQDVILLENVYLELRPWMHNHPNVNIVDDDEKLCPACGSDHLQKRGFEITNSGLTKYQRYQCQDCAKWSKGKPIRTGIEIR